jgi:hypothetical protein
MKWGVRNDKGHEGQRVRVSKLPKLDKKWEKKLGAAGIKLQNAVADRMNAPDGGINKINNNPKYRDKDFTKPENAKLQQQYFRDYTKELFKSYQQVAKDAGTNPSGTRSIVAEKAPGNGEVYFRFQDISHAGIEDDLEFVGILDSKGFVTSIVKLEGDGQMEQSDPVDDFLAHFGIKGMRWGVRRKNPKEGASKDAGESIDIRTKAKTGKVKSLSNAELRTAIERMNLEQNFKRLSVNEKSAIGRFISSTLLDIGKREVSDFAGKTARGFVVKKMLTGGLA